MSLWPKPDVIPILPPSKPKRWVWIMTFIVLFAITAIFLILSWGDENYFNSLSFWLVLIMLPATLGSVALSIRFYFYGLAQERFDIWQQEQKQVNDNWQDWAMSGTHVIASAWYTPNELTASKILLQRQNLAVQIDKVLAFGDEQRDYAHSFEDVFYQLSSPLNQLPDNIKVAITIYSSLESYSYLDDIVFKAYQQSSIKQPYTLQHQLTPTVHIEKVIDLIDNPDHTLQLLVFNNLKSSCSAFFSAILIIGEPLLSQFGSQLSIELESKIIRPMIAKDISAAIGQMAQMQPALLDVKQLWCANLNKQQEVEIVKQLAQQNISLDNINYLDSIAGKQNDLAYWSLLSLGSQLVKQSQQTLLLATSHQDECIFSVLSKDNLGITNEE